MLVSTIGEHEELEKYVKNFKNCGLKVGDKVKVMEKAESEKNGWWSTWYLPMNRMIGKIYKIVGNNGRSFLLQNKDGDIFPFPYFVLGKTF